MLEKYISKFKIPSFKYWTQAKRELLMDGKDIGSEIMNVLCPKNINMI